ncbi:MAG: XTP/dITP diphosphatase [Thermodesulfobacteriota bacterium]
MKILVASSNEGKVREIRELLTGEVLEVLSLENFPDLVLPPETADSFAGNALIKARFAAGETGLVTISDDSGLQVDFLSGAPGVWSARYAGERASDKDNYEKLLAELKGVKTSERTARFKCVVALIGLEFNEELVFEGTFEGVIAEEPRGTSGFGYDPVFYIPALKKTAAELTSEEKNRVSHRGAALRKLSEKLKEYFV